MKEAHVSGRASEPQCVALSCEVMFLKYFLEHLGKFIYVKVVSLITHLLMNVMMRVLSWCRSGLIDYQPSSWLTVRRRSLLTETNTPVLHILTRSLLPRKVGGSDASSRFPWERCGDEASLLCLTQVEVAALPLTASCRLCTLQCSSSALGHWSASPGRSGWSARNCTCWRRSGRFHEAPDTPRTAGPCMLSDSYLMMSEAGHHLHHLRLYAIRHMGNYIIICTELTFQMIVVLLRLVSLV